MKCLVDRIRYPVLTLPLSCRYYRSAGTFQCRFHILEIDIDITRFGDDFGNASCRVGKCVVGFAESIEEIQILI